MKHYIVRQVQSFPDYLVLSLMPEAGHEPLSFWPGQYAAISFRSHGRPTPVRCFSVTTSPASGELQFAMRPRGRFTRRVARLKPGDPVSVQGPFGNFVIDPSDRSLVLLAAGVGITPFMSMLRSAAETRLDLPITLLYAGRDTRSMPFVDELSELQRQNRNLRVVILVQQGTDDPTRQIYNGRLDGHVLQRATDSNSHLHTFFVCGPLNFSKSMQRLLRAQRVPDERIVSEAFSQSATMDWRPRLLSIPGMTYALTGLLLLVGIGGVMALDLSRYVPKKAAAIGITKPIATPGSPSAGGDAQTQSPDGTSASMGNTPTSTTATSPVNNTNSQHYFYQPPMSSVS